MDQQRCLLATETLRLTADGDWAHAFSNCMALLCPIIDAAAAAPSGAASVNSTRQNANNGQVLTRLFCGVPGRKPLVTDSLVFVLLRFIFPMSPGLFPPTMKCPKSCHDFAINLLVVVTGNPQVADPANNRLVSLALVILGFFNHMGIGLRINLAAAVQCFRRSQEPPYSNSFAQYFLGKCYYTGEGVEEDKLEAYHLFVKSAAQRNPLAIRGVGMSYDNGTTDAGVPDHDSAIRYYTQASEEHNWASAQFNLGWMHLGMGDQEKAAAWFFLSARQGYDCAQYQVGLSYFQGYVPGHIDKRESKRWMLLSHSQGYSPATVHLDTYFLWYNRAAY